MLELIIDNQSSADFGLALYERPNIPSPQRDIRSTPVPGRAKGTLTEKLGYLDLTIPVKLNLLSRDIKLDLRAIRAWLMGAHKMQFSDDDVYYIVKSVSIGNADNRFRRLGLFDVAFTCEPFQYADPTTITLTAPGTKLYNPGTETAEPYIKVTGTGSVNLVINGRGVAMTLTDYIEIDTELGYAFRGTAGADDKVNGELPVLTPGENNISWTGNITKLEIVYRAVYV